MRLENLFALQRALEAEAEATNIGAGFATPELEPLRLHGLRFSAQRDPLMGLTIIAAMADDHVSVTWSDLSMAREYNSIARRLSHFLHSLPHRFRASYARPAEPWPACLPPMLGPSYTIGDAFDGEGLPPMFPTTETSTP